MIAKLRERIGEELESLSEELQRSMGLEPREMDAGGARRLDEGRVTAIQQRMSVLGGFIAGLATLEPGMIPMNRVGFGSVVRIRDMATGEEHTYTMMTSDLIDLNEGHVSLASPLGHATLGRSQGDEVSVATPRGMRRYKILTLGTLHERLAARLPQSPAPRTDVLLQAV